MDSTMERFSRLDGTVRSAVKTVGMRPGVIDISILLQPGPTRRFPDSTRYSSPVSCQSPNGYNPFRIHTSLGTAVTRATSWTRYSSASAFRP